MMQQVQFCFELNSFEVNILGYNKVSVFLEFAS